MRPCRGRRRPEACGGGGACRTRGRAWPAVQPPITGRSYVRSLVSWGSPHPSRSYTLHPTPPHPTVLPPPPPPSSPVSHPQATSACSSALTSWRRRGTSSRRCCTRSTRARCAWAQRAEGGGGRLCAHVRVCRWGSVLLRSGTRVRCPFAARFQHRCLCRFAGSPLCRWPPSCTPTAAAARWARTTWRQSTQSGEARRGHASRRRRMWWRRRVRSRVRRGRPALIHAGRGVYACLGAVSPSGLLPDQAMLPVLGCLLPPPLLSLVVALHSRHAFLLTPPPPPRHPPASLRWGDLANEQDDD